MEYIKNNNNLHRLTLQEGSPESCPGITLDDPPIMALH
nr:hypothetical protein BAR15_120171 [Bartonella sp. AR 15-3]